MVYHHIIILFRESKTEPEEAGRERGRAVTPEGHATVPRAVVPTAPTEHAVRARRGTRGIRLSGAAVGAAPVLTPFKHIAAHVVETEFIRLLCGNGMFLIAAIVLVPRYVCERVAAAVVVTFTSLAATGCIFPLGLCGQAELLACELVEFCDEGLTVVPGNVFYR